jgi:peptidyl-prolyl cis-trans isomerase SurA
MIKRLATLALLGLSFAASAEVQMLDRIVAVVNDGVIMESELTERVERIRQRMRDQGQSLPPNDVMRRQVLDRMVEQTLQLQLADRASIKVDDNALNRALAQIARGNGMTLEEFAQDMKDSGESWKAFREQIRREMIISRLQQRQVGRRVRITDRELERFLESERSNELFKTEYHLRHILLRTSTEASSKEVQQTRARAQELVEQLRGGADFRDLAVKHSEGQFALEGGDLGWRPAAELPTLFAETARDMEAGAISDPLRSGAGIHILKLIERRGGDQKMVEQHKVRHILIDANEVRGPAEAEERIRELHRRVVEEGADFAELARRFSDDPGSARDGGSLDWVSPGEMVPTFEEVMKNTSVGQVSRVFETRFGWHFLRVEDERTADMSGDYRRSRARRALQKRRFQEELRRWLQERRGQAYIDLRLDESPS